MRQGGSRKRGIYIKKRMTRGPFLSWGDRGARAQKKESRMRRRRRRLRTKKQQQQKKWESIMLNKPTWKGVWHFESILESLCSLRIFYEGERLAMASERRNCPAFFFSLSLLLFLLPARRVGGPPEDGSFFFSFSLPSIATPWLSPLPPRFFACARCSPARALYRRPPTHPPFQTRTPRLADSAQVSFFLLLTFVFPRCVINCIYAIHVIFLFTLHARSYSLCLQEFNTKNRKPTTF